MLANIGSGNFLTLVEDDVTEPVNIGDWALVSLKMHLQRNPRERDRQNTIAVEQLLLGHVQNTPLEAQRHPYVRRDREGRITRLIPRVPAYHLSNVLLLELNADPEYEDMELAGYTKRRQPNLTLDSASHDFSIERFSAVADETRLPTPFVPELVVSLH